MLRTTIDASILLYRLKTGWFSTWMWRSSIFQHPGCCKSWMKALSLQDGFVRFQTWKCYILNLSLRWRTEWFQNAAVFPSQCLCVQQLLLFIHEYRYSCKQWCVAIFKGAGTHLSGEVCCSFGRCIIFTKLMWTNEKQETHVVLSKRILLFGL